MFHVGRILYNVVRQSILRLEGYLHQAIQGIQENASITDKAAATTAVQTQFQTMSHVLSLPYLEREKRPYLFFILPGVNATMKDVDTADSIFILRTYDILTTVKDVFLFKMNVPVRAIDLNRIEIRETEEELVTLPDEKIKTRTVTITKEDQYKIYPHTLFQLQFLRAVQNTYPTSPLDDEADALAARLR